MSLKRKISFAALALVILAATFFPLAGCSPADVPSPGEKKEGTGAKGKEEYPLELEDHLGREVIIDERPQNIITLAPSHTEILFALGLEEEITGVSDYCDYPSAALEKEKIGGFEDPSLEKIVALEPDLVLGVPYHEDLLFRLEELGISSLAFEPNSLQELFKTIETIGLAAGYHSEGRELSYSMQDEISRILTKVEEIPENERLSVFFEIWHDPLQTVGKGSLLYELLELISSQVVTDPGGGEYPHFSQEKLFEEDPDFYFATSGSMSEYSDLKKRPGWDALSAAKNENVHIISDENTIYRAGPRIVEGLEEMVNALYPDIK